MTSAAVDVGAAFPVPGEAEADDAWQTYEDVELLLGALAGGWHRSGLTVDAEAQVTRLIGRLRARKMAGTTPVQRDALERLMAAVGALRPSARTGPQHKPPA